MKTKNFRQLSLKKVAILGPGRHADGDGLYLHVRESGRTWTFRYQKHGRRHELGLGSWPAVSLYDAREKAAAMRRNLALGRQVRTSTVNTFADVALGFIARQRPAWHSAKHAAQWESTLEQYAYPSIGQMPVQEITTSHVLAILAPIWATKNETASRVRGRIEAVLDAARVQGLRPDGTNPAQWRGHLDKLLPPRSRIRQVRHHRALSFEKTRALFARLAGVPGEGARALRFVILTAARTNEVLGARRSEVADSIWTIPASRMKSGRVHRVPLTDKANDLIAGHSQYLFPLSNMAMPMLLRRLGVKATVHGFRSTFRDWCAENDWPREVAEACLAHAIESKTEAAYLRSDLLSARRELMEAWAQALSGGH